MGDLNQLKVGTLCNSFKLKQIVDRATRGSAILDKILTNLPELYSSPQVTSHLGKSDHQMVVAKPCTGTDWSPPKSNKIITESRKPTYQQKCDLAEALRATDWTSLYHSESCEEQFSIFSNQVNHLMDTYCPTVTKVKYSNDKPWISESFKMLISQRQAARAQGEEANYRVLRNKINRLRTTLRSSFYVSTVKDTNPTQWWQGVKKLLGSKTSDNSMSTLATHLCNGDQKALANKINETFQSVSQDLVPLTREAPQAHQVPDDLIITVESVDKKLSDLNLHKAVGPDQVPNWFLKENAILLAKPISAIFNSSVRQSVVPGLWKEANVIPLPKVSPVSRLEKDLRPIALTPVLAKTLESYIVSWMRNMSVHSPTQYGAVKGSSTTHGLIYLVHTILAGLDGGNRYARILLLDFSKAFDHIDNNILLRKLRDNNIPDILVSWQRAFLTERKQSVKIGNIVSDSVNMNGGVPQGTLSGPEDFLHMIDDFTCGVDDIKYVDDTSVYEIVGIGEESKLQQAADEAIEWASANNMKLNASKTKELLIHFGKNNIEIPNIVMEGETVERVHCAKLLGVLLSDRLTWDDHVATIINKASKRLYYLRQLKRSGLSAKELIKVYLTMIRPITEYACQVWSNSLTHANNEQIESIQKRALKIISPSLTYKDAMDMHQLPRLQDRRDNLCRKMFNTIMMNSDNRLHGLLPAPKESKYNLRETKRFPLPRTKTNRFKNSFINWGLYKCQ